MTSFVAAGGRSLSKVDTESVAIASAIDPR
jgi:hypothetical protein